MILAYLIVHCVVLFGSLPAVPLSNNSVLIHKRQAIQQANVCNANECTFGTCEIISTYNYACHCNSGFKFRSRIHLV